MPKREMQREATARLCRRRSKAANMRQHSELQIVCHYIFRQSLSNAARRHIVQNLLGPDCLQSEA